MSVRFSSRNSESWRFRLPNFGERKPSKTKLCSGSPAIEAAAIQAEGPGTGMMGISASMHWISSRYPGSDMVGVPASDTSAIDSPAFKRATSLFALLDLVALKVTGGRRINLVMDKQAACMASVLCSDQVNLFEGPQRPECDVFQIADRCAYNVQDTLCWIGIGGLCHLLKSRQKNRRPRARTSPAAGRFHPEIPLWLHLPYLHPAPAPSAAR